jgi:hypothetical protein
MNSKQLHKHAIPIIMLSLGLGLVSVIALSHVVISQSSTKAQAAGADMLSSTNNSHAGIGNIGAAGQGTVLDASLATPTDH